MRRLMLCALVAGAARGDARLLGAWRRGDRAAIARAADASPMGEIARMLGATRAERLAALAALAFRDDGLLLLEVAAALAAGDDADTARAAARTAWKLVRAATPDAIETLDLPPESVDAARASLLGACAGRGPAAARVDALFALDALDALDRATLADAATACAAVAAADVDPALRLGAVLLLASRRDGHEDVLDALARDRDPDVAAEALLALCRRGSLLSADPRLATALAAPLPPPLLSDLGRCAAKKR